MAIFNVSIGGTIYDSSETAIPNCLYEAYYDSYAGTHPAMWKTNVGTANSSGVFQFNLGDSDFLYEDTEGSANVSGDNVIVCAYTGGSARSAATLSSFGFIVIPLSGLDTYITNTDLRIRANQEPETTMSIGTALTRETLQTLVNNSTDNTSFAETAGNYATIQYQYDDTNDISGVSNVTVFDYVGVSHVSVNWGDASSGTATGESNITHTYTETGGSTVTITGTAADDMSLLDSTPWSSGTINILWRAPTITDLAYTPQSASEPVPNQTATMSATIGDLDSRATTQYWSVDDGSTYPHTAASVGDNFLYAFPTSGTHNVRTKVAWNDGFAAQEVVSSQLAVVVRNDLPVAYYAIEAGYPSSSSASSYSWISTSTDNDGIIANYEWNLYDSPDSGTTYNASAISTLSGTASTFTFDFTTAGFYKLKLTVTDDDAGTNDYETTFEVTVSAAAGAGGYLIIGSPILQGVT